MTASVMALSVLVVLLASVNARHRRARRAGWTEMEGLQERHAVLRRRHAAAERSLTYERQQHLDTRCRLAAAEQRADLAEAVATSWMIRSAVHSRRPTVVVHPEPGDNPATGAAYVMSGLDAIMRELRQPQTEETTR